MMIDLFSEIFAYLQTVENRGKIIGEQSLVSYLRNGVLKIHVNAVMNQALYDAYLNYTRLKAGDSCFLDNRL